MPSVLDTIAGRNAAQQRRVVENKKGETIDIAEGSAAGLLVTNCEGCTINAPGRLSGVTIERCGGGTAVNVGSVVASLEVIRCTDVKVSVARCRTITVDVSTNVSVSCKCQPPSDHQQQQQQQQPEEEAKVHPGAAAEEASAVRLFTSCSEGVSISFGSLRLLPPSAGGAADAADAADDATWYRVPKDGRYEKGDGPRSVSRVTVVDNDGGGGGGEGGRCKTLRCDQYGIPLEQAEAEKAGVPWTWEGGRRPAEEM